MHLPTKGWPGWVDLHGWLHTKINVPHQELNQNTVAHPNDHFPIVITSANRSCEVSNRTWKLGKADWSTFTDRASWELGHLVTEDHEDAVEYFVNALGNIAHATLPRSRLRNKTNNTLWYNEEYNAASRNRRKALLKVKTSTYSVNTENYCIVWAKARWVAKSHDAAVGPGDIHYQMLKHQPLDAQQTLLTVLNARAPSCPEIPEILKLSWNFIRKSWYWHLLCRGYGIAFILYLVTS